MTILQGDALSILRTLPDDFFNCVMTSPPYWGLRDYGLSPIIRGGSKGCEHEWGHIMPEHHPGQVEQSKWKSAEGAGKGQTAGSGQYCSLCGAWRGQLGLEPTFQEYIAHLMEIFTEVKRVLRDDGCCFVNLGDSYASSSMTPNRSRHVLDEFAYGIDGTKQSDSQVFDRVYCRYDGELQDGCRNHCDCIFHNEKSHQQCVLHSCMIGHDNGHWDSVSSFLDAFAHVFQESNIPSSSQNAQVFSSEHKVLESLFEIHSFLRGVHQSLDKALNISGIFETLLSLDCHIRGKVLSFLALESSRGLTSYNIPIASHNVKLNNKSLCQIPSRFAIAMSDAGWVLRNEIIWYKRNAMPASVKDRFTVDFEKVFFFVKSKKYWFEQQRESAITPNYKIVGDSRNMRCVWDIPSEGNLEKEVINLLGSDVEPTLKWGILQQVLELGVSTSLWDIPTKPCKEAHFAIFPDTLVERCLKAGCPVDGWVLDPFGGTCTTGRVAEKQGKGFVGIELNPDYIKIAERMAGNGTR